MCCYMLFMVHMVHAAHVVHTTHAVYQCSPMQSINAVPCSAAVAAFARRCVQGSQLIWGQIMFVCY